SPMASTTPVPSCPRTAGNLIGDPPLNALTSVWHTPVATRRTSNSASRGESRSRSAIAMSCPGASSNAAFTSGLGAYRPAVASTRALIYRISAWRQACEGGTGMAVHGWPIVDSDGHVVERDSEICEFLEEPFRSGDNMLNFPFFPTLDGFHRG